MPQIILNVSVENGLRVVAALEHSGFLRLDSEGDIAYTTRYARQRFIGLVHTHEQYEAIESVPLDEDVVT